MQKKFLKNLALLVFLNLLVKPFWIFGIDRSVQNAVGPESYGFYFAILNFSFLFFIFLDLGLTNFNNRNIAQNNQLLNKHMAGIATLKLLLGVGYGILVFIIGWIIGYSGEQLYLLAWVGFNQFLLSLILYLRSNLSGLLLFKTDSLISVLDRTLMILICGFLLWSNYFEGRFTIRWFVYSQTAAYLITAMIALVAVLKRSGRLKLNWNPLFFLMILKKSMPFALLVLLMSFYNRIDPVLIERLLPGVTGKIQSGIYAQAFRLLDAGQNFAYLFSVLLLPLFARMIKDKMPVVDLVKLSFSIIISGSLILAISSSFYSSEVMQLLYSPFGNESASDFQLRIEQSAHIFQLLMFSLVAISSNYIFGTLLTANNNLRYLNLVALTGLLVNIGLNFILIPRFMAYGSAIASLSTQGLTAVFQMIIAVKVLHLKINWALVRGVAALVVSMVVSGYFLRYATPLNWIGSLLVMISIGLIVAFLFRLLSIKEFLKTIRQ